MTVPPVDRAAAVRGALRTLVARNGFHGASMSAVASQAGVATGTAYTHYASKDELVLAAYRETKAQLAAAAMADLDAAAPPAEQFRGIWLATYRHLKTNPDHARFLLQVDHSPYRSAAHQAAIAGDDPLAAQAATPGAACRLLPLPLEVIYELGLSPAVRLAAGATELTDNQLNEIAAACWRAISLPSPAEPSLPAGGRRVSSGDYCGGVLLRAGTFTRVPHCGRVVSVEHCVTRSSRGDNRNSRSAAQGRFAGNRA